jgi:hypothetical protein
MQMLFDDARATDGLCPLCYSNKLLDTPFEFEPPNEVLKKARELIQCRDSFGVVLEGLHDAFDDDDKAGDGACVSVHHARAAQQRRRLRDVMTSVRLAPCRARWILVR